MEVECSHELHAPFFTESRINNPVEGCEAGNPGARSLIGHFVLLLWAAVDREVEPYPTSDGLAQEVTPSERKL